MATLADGGFVAAWAGGSASAIFAQRFAPDGARLGTTLRVSSTASSLPETTAVTALADGGFVVAWEGSASSGGGGRYAYIQRFDADGVRQGGETRLQGGGSYGLPSLAPLADGGFVVSWFGSDANGANAGVRLQQFTGTGAREVAEFRASDVPGARSTMPETSVAALADGGYALAWTGSSVGPGQPTPSTDIHVQRFAADGSLVGSASRASATTADLASAPVIAGLADGGFVVAWNSRFPQAGESYDVYAQRFSADGGRVGGEFRANTSAANHQEEPAIAALADGGFVITWQSLGADPSAPRGTSLDIYAQRFSAAGIAVGGELRVNTTTVLNQRDPVVTAAGDGLIVSWLGASNTAGASPGDMDVFAQRFSLPALVEEAGIARIGTSSAEGDAGSADFTFGVVLDAPAASTRSVRWQVEGSGPNPAGASDFAGNAPPSGTVAFAPGESSKSITVTIAGDVAIEPHEGFTVRLFDPSTGLVLGTANAVAAIFDDDRPVVWGAGSDDVLVRAPGGSTYEGMGGRDTLDMNDLGYRGMRGASQPDGSLLLERGDESSLLRGIEVVRFADGRLVLDVDDAAAQVVRLYEAALDRLPDQGGLNFWIGAVQGGQPLSALAAGFLASGEFAARFGGAGTSNGAFVDRLYQNVLGRAGEQGGRDFWVGSLDRGAGRADVLAAFAESAENKAGTAALVQAGIWDRSEATAQAARMYDTVLGRKPDLSGLTFWKSALEDGTATLAQMADAFTGSAEFRAQYGSLSNRDFANALYVNTLDRPADQAGLDYWAGQLASGMARSTVVLAFSESAEHVALTANTIQSENPAQYGILFA